MNDEGVNVVRSDVGVLGAGIMGCCLALELAGRGYSVDLIDQAHVPMTGASLHNEGKLHLGYVYANDPSKKTHGLMLRGSLAFSNIIEKLTGCKPESLEESQPFQYYIPTDSQLDMEAIISHFEVIEDSIHQLTQNSENLYLGRKHDRYFERNSSDVHASMFSTSLTLGSFSTKEVSVSTHAVADVLSKAVMRNPKINFIGGAEVVSADRKSSGDIEVEIRRDGEETFSKYACVANCLWDDRLRVDRTAGICDDGPWLLRYKAMISVSAPAAETCRIPSATGILGTYGDVVNHNNGSYYISWYPLCKRAEIHDENGRKLHDKVHSILSRAVKRMVGDNQEAADFVTSITHRKFIKDNIRKTADYIPSVGNLLNSRKQCKVTGGVIMARGSTDIDDPASYLHQRSAVGPVAHDSYVTIDTGKYCTAPLFAVEAADMISDIL